MGEVFTPPETVKNLLDDFPDSAWSENETFLDSTCGNGNLLLEVLSRKIKNGSAPLRALQTVYGVDVMQDNVWECRRRLFEVSYSYDKNPTKEWRAALLTNIRCANALEKSLEEIFSAPPDEVDKG